MRLETEAYKFGFMESDEQCETFCFDRSVTDLLNASLRFLDFHFIVFNGGIQLAEFSLKRFQFFFSLLPHLLLKQKHAIIHTNAMYVKPEAIISSSASFGFNVF